MPLIQSTAQATAAEIIGDIEHLAGCAVASAIHLNSITARILALPNDDLAEFGNSLGPQEMQSLTTLHGLQGERVNALVDGINAIHATIGKPPIGSNVDVRPLAEKLAEQFRAITMDESGVFSVIDLPRPEVPAE